MGFSPTTNNVVGACPGALSETVSLIRGVNKKEAHKLLSIGITSFEQLSDIAPATLTKLLGWNSHKANDIVLHARALAHNTSYQKAQIEFPQGVIFFYDVETFGALTYLHGIVRWEGGEREERSFVAGNPADEGVAWRDFLDHLSQYREAVVYSWTNYERGCVNRLWDTYAGNREGWKLLNENLQDHCALTKNHFALPTKSYGLKSVAPIFGFQWHTPNPSGRKAEEWYRLWLETGDEAILNEIITYNLDDVRAMEAIHHGLIRIAKEG